MPPAPPATQVTCANIAASCEFIIFPRLHIDPARMHAGLCVGLPWLAGSCDVTSRFLMSPVETDGSEECRGVVRTQVPLWV